jgi:1-acyl-sn-glycerol-3-phosphate acyltransferase
VSIKSGEVLLAHAALILLKVLGWQVDLKITVPDKCVLIGAPHTTNWDFPYGILALTSMGIKFNWVGKHTLFKPPMGWVFRQIGGIPINRSSSKSFMMNVIALFGEREKFILAIAPEGTRSKTDYWKAGFYTIANKASVPIVLGCIDYPKKKIEIGEILMPTGDLEQDSRVISNYYMARQGKYPENQGGVIIKTPNRKC